MWSGLVVVGVWVTACLVAFGGDFEARYFVFAIPQLLAVALYAITELARRQHSRILALLAAAIVLNAVLPGRYDYPLLVRQITANVWESDFERRAAPVVDQMLSRCHEERYMIAGIQLQALAAYTKHSPYQIFYGQIRSLGSPFRPSLKVPNAFLAAKLTEDLASTRIIVEAADDNDDPAPSIVSKTVQDHFTETPPGCAAGLVPYDGLRVFFRRN